MIKPCLDGLDGPVSIPNDLPIYNVVKIDWKQNPQHNARKLKCNIREEMGQSD